MEDSMKNVLFGLILIIFGVSLVPVVFTTVGNANWSLLVGSNTYDLAWVGYLIGLVFAIAILGVGIAVLVKSFKNK